MRMSPGEFEAYRDFVEEAGVRAGRELAKSILQYMENNPQWADDIPALRRSVKESALRSIGKYADLSSGRSLQLFNDIINRLGIDWEGSAGYRVDEDAIERAIRYQLRWLVGGNSDVEKFIDEMDQLCHYHVSKASDDTVSANVGALHKEAQKPSYKGDNPSAWAFNYDRNRRKRMQQVRYARVLTSPEPCTWCTMLASRGFDYKSEKTANAGSHRGCKCRFVPGIKDETKIPGYDQEQLLDLWQEMENIDAKQITQAEKKELKRQLIASVGEKP